ncbi:sugar transferase [Spirulina sp. CS-785/01]|uniref:sugar transferase n=1 Tax=Spirulina sp. CS-785/01 TaxID=3021716 RepID=UPI00232AC247|nr:sugar transferase [Spirulina sp. CS-785/01]MDB9312624.1 sugar transferase [Spirulina sp. CS-785/01]
MTSQTPDERFPIVFTEGTPVIRIPPRLSVIEAVDFKTTCQSLLEDHEPIQEMILDFSGTMFMDSSGVGALVSTHKAVVSQGGTLILHQVSPPVMAVLSMTSLDKVLNITPASLPENSNQPQPPQRPPETHPSVRSPIKRLIDIVGSLVGLAITGIILIPVAIAIKRDSPGPIFFGQTRCGWLGRHFKMWKFRSMRPDAERLKHQVQNQASGSFFKNTNDFRVTRVGKFLRRTSLDELPQFWNVLKGEMSLVGTRPPTPDEVATYQIPEWQRLDVKPGMTGEWQVSGRSQVRNFEDVIRLDLRYQRNWSLMYDLKLIAKTVWILFQKNSGAY